MLDVRGIPEGEMEGVWAQIDGNVDDDDKHEEGWQKVGWKREMDEYYGTMFTIKVMYRATLKTGKPQYLSLTYYAQPTLKIMQTPGANLGVNKYSSFIFEQIGGGAVA